MKVICMDAESIKTLTEGEIYELVTKYEVWNSLSKTDLIQVIDDMGEIMWVGKYRFELVNVATPFEEFEQQIDDLFKYEPLDQVNHPSHYNQGKYEVIDVIEDWNLGFNLGNTIKYIGRAGHKDSKIQDLEKAKWYLEREIQNLKNKEVPF